MATLDHAGLRRHEFSVQHIVGTFALRNACVLYRTQKRRNLSVPVARSVGER